ncbi:metalloregulator ArsR/SmtB family transcription factor [Ciceribacter sp. RN22]|uniref:metalloregulator ArsR/SmtB family transcription factor n=1 Tax=Ciceribacter sp. RN22 TaxID=2954932 RepID=UPI002093AD03|nr:metalloregulator ArsR/SmtB family transcription factor [Ciceribacter sp. RN22]MCO6178678.1 metalloregulator ArsR/SmtB family transcription factor [Ciceribacter sp. RN22]
MQKRGKKTATAGRDEKREQKIFQALAAAPRRAILRHLAASSLTAGEIASHFTMAKPSISQHLAILEGAGLVSREKRGQFVHYALAHKVLEPCLAGFLQDVGMTRHATPAPPEDEKPAGTRARGAARSASTEKATPAEPEADAGPAEKPAPAQMSMF